MLHHRLIADSLTVEQDACAVILNRAGRRVRLTVPDTALLTVLTRLHETGFTEAELNRVVAQSRSPQLMAFWVRLAAGLAAAYWIETTVLAGEETLVRLQPLTPAPGFGSAPGAARLSDDDVLRVAPTAVLRFGEPAPTLESGAAHHVAHIEDTRMLDLLVGLRESATVGDTCRDSALADRDTRAALTALYDAGLLTAERDTPVQASAADYWSDWELLFHARSRLGRTRGDYGGTFRFRGVRDPWPGIPQGFGAGELIELPSDEGASRSLLDVARSRCSIREHDAENPVTAAQLGALLSRTQRVRFVREVEGYGDILRRGYPAGGSLYELEIFVLANRCADLDQGLYHYDSARHGLRRIATGPGDLERLSQVAQVTAQMAEPPQVVLLIAARFPRVMWKYDAVSYAVILKNVGALYDALYLHATDLGLAPCGLGGGDSDLFSAVTQIPYLECTTVGEFILGSRPVNWQRPSLPAWHPEAGGVA